MKIVHFRLGERDLYGVAEGETAIEIEGSIFGEFAVTTRRHQLSTLKLLPPTNPSKIVAVGLNYVDHAREIRQPLPKEPFIFFEAPSSLIAHGEDIVLSEEDHEVHHEAELAFIVGSPAKNVPVSEALNYIFGYTCANDVSDRTVQRREGAPDRAKSFDTFTPLGPFVATDVDPRDLKIECLVNGQLRQSSSTAQLVFDVPVLLSYISRVMTLLPGDVVLTGTAAGVGPIHPGDTVEVRIAGIGTLRNQVRAAKPV